MTRLSHLAALLAAPLLALPAAAQTSDMAGMHAGHNGFPQTLADWAAGAQLFPDLGSFHRDAGTRVPAAQAYFDQGMRLLWAFNHDEAARSFAKAAEADPKCGICYWGVALTLGPNYNMPMMAEARARVAWDALKQAEALAPSATPANRALILALTKRYTGPKPIDPGNSAPLLAAFGDAMRSAAKAFPQDDDILTLFAEAQMNRTPWKLWNADGTPARDTPEIVTTLETVLKRNPAHPGANHYYIHAVEASATPDRAVAAADRVGPMMPGAGHLVHMPSHIYQRVGRYEESAVANRRADAADKAYYTKTAAIDYYPMYSAHNLQFLAASTAMEGRGAETIKALRDVRLVFTDEMAAGMPGMDWGIGYLYEALIRFGRWDEMLAEPQPDARLLDLTVNWLSARTIAFAAKGQRDEAKAELAKLKAKIAGAPADALAGMNLAAPLFRIAELRAEARIAWDGGDKPAAVAALREAVKVEDTLSYNEPSDEFFPSRHLLGAALLGSGLPEEAEAVYRADLAPQRNPRNGWALFGLAQALKAQGKDASQTEKDFAAAWVRADVTLSASAF
jgi:tetratricopeptide (TPR) repeat protein